MSIPLGTNKLKLVRRHSTTNCDRFKGHRGRIPLTPKPHLKKEEKADTCRCTIWCLGYLAKETEIVNGKVKAKRVFASLGVNNWGEAETETAKLYERGSLPGARHIDPNAITVQFAKDRFLASRGPTSTKPAAESTYDKYVLLLDELLIPFCTKRQVKLIKEFESEDLCRQFTESWRQVRRNVGEPLGLGYREVQLIRMKAFLNFCVAQGWTQKNGAKGIQASGGEIAIRYGLELDEYDRLIQAPPSPALTDQENQENLAAVELMRWCGLRESDAYRFNASNIVRNETGDGSNADYIQQKTEHTKSGGHCISPMPDHVVEMLGRLRGRVENGVKYFFNAPTISAFIERVNATAKRAQKEKSFAHHFSPHCLRHTFAIQHLIHGTPIEYVSKWLGHQSVEITREHYQNWIRGTRLMAEQASRDAVARMLGYRKV